MVSVPELRPERGPATAGRHPVPQPRDPGELPAGLDLQGGHGGRRARHRQVHAGLDHRRLVAEGDQRRAAGERRRPELRPDPAHRRAHQLGQHGLRRGGREASAARRWSSTWSRFGFNQDPQLDYPRRADERERRSRGRERRAAGRRRRLRRRPRGDRPGRRGGRHPRDAAADGPGRRARSGTTAC